MNPEITPSLLGLLLTETRPLEEGVSYVTKYKPDANGNRTKVTYPSARAVDE